MKEIISQIMRIECGKTLADVSSKTFQLNISSDIAFHSLEQQLDPNGQPQNDGFITSTTLCQWIPTLDKT